MSTSYWTRYRIFFSIGCITVAIVSCSSGQLRHKRISLTNDEQLSGYGSFYGSDYGKEVFSKYCSDGKQVRELKINLREVTPKLPLGIPVDEAAMLNQEIHAQGSCYVQGALWFTSHIRDCDEDWGRDIYDYEQDKNCHGEDASELGRSTSDLSPEVISYAKDIRTLGAYNRSSGKFESCSQGLACSMNPVFVMTPESKRLLLIFEPSEGRYIRSKRSRENNYVDIGVQKAFLSELNILKDQYSMILPIEFQEKYFGENGNTIADILNRRCQFGFPQTVKVNAKNEHIQYVDTYASKKSYLGYEDGRQECKNGSANVCEDVNGALSLRLVAEERESIWLRYILAFTSVKEAVQADPQVTDYEISLNLEPFCKYARPMTDLISR